MNTLILAWRNIFRNGRRSALTVLAIMVAAVSVILFGGFVRSIFLAIETQTVRQLGHLEVFRTGYFEYGSGNPGAYGIDHYLDVMDLVGTDATLRPLVRLVTPTLQMMGIAGNFQEIASKTFLGHGYIPSARQRMALWDGYGLGTRRWQPPTMSDDDTEGGVIGVGLARILHLCAALKIPNCDDRPSEAADASPAGPAEDFSQLPEVAAPETAAPGDQRPRVDLLAATSAGAPNVVTLYLAATERQGAKEVDDSYVAMHLDLAQRLLYGRGEHKVTALVIQLNQSQDIAATRAALERLFADRHLALEVRDFTELYPFYTQVKGMFLVIFGFIALVLGVIVIFTVTNTMTMTVMERITEIGTLRALGLRRWDIRSLFLSEGLLLGTLSAAAGVALGTGISLLVNRAGLTWMPPSHVEPAPLTIQVIDTPLLMAGCWLSLVLLAALSALLPANKAARMEVVDALRHV